MRSTLLLLMGWATWVFSPGVVVAQADSWRSSLEPMLRECCWDCHDGSEPAGGLDLRELNSDLHDAEVMRRWTLVHDRLVAGEMPPGEERQPTSDERQQAVKALAGALTAADRARSEVVLRRLNRVEYEHTVRDLFQTDVRVAELLPRDNPTEGFDNIGEGLAFSAEAAEAYLIAADVVLDAVLGPPQPPPYIKHETNLLDQKTWDGKPELSQVGKMFRRTDDGLVIFQSGYCPTNLLNFARLRVPAGTYRGRFKVRAVQSDQPVTLRIYAGDTIVGRRENHLVGYFDVPPNEWTTIEFEDRLVEPGGTFQPKCYGTRDTRQDADSYPEPGIEISDIVIEGPLETWPPPSRGLLLGDVDIEHGTLDDIRAIHARLLPRAFRRPISDADAEPLIQLAADALAEGRSFEAALRLSLKAVLCSPDFLFLDEPGTDVLEQHALATRLSYFLWSSLPDADLLALAAAGSLSDPQTLRQQVERMLDDPKAAAFTRNFVGQWLDLRDIDFTSPDAMLYPDFDELLRISMVEETHLFFNEILANDLSLLNFVDSDFTFLNQRLAEHYGMSGVRGQAFQKVELPADSVRGGVLTQASVLKVTANGTTTSPVIRGVWVMENLLGQQVPPPPSNVPAVEPDIRGAVTLREQLAKHRDVESCAACHERIDPPGFALENFDVIGGWREHYRTLGEGQRPDFKQDPHTFAWIRWRIGLPVDATGTTRDGQAFSDIREFKQILLGDERTIARGLTQKLATYALGRKLGFADREEIDQMVHRVSQRNFGFRSLVHEVVQSQMFQRP